MNRETEVSERNVDIDLCRIIACLMVIYHHSIAYGFMFSLTPGGLQYYMHLTLGVICCAGVPLFFEISGALLLERKWEGCALAKRMIHILVPFVLFSLMFYCFGARETGFIFREFLVKLYQNEINYSYWFFYTYILMIIMMPFTALIAIQIKKEENKKLVVYIGILQFLYWVVIPFFELLFQNKYVAYHSMIIPVDIIYAMFFPIIGWWYYNYFDLQKFNKVIAFLVFTVSVTITVVMTYYRQVSLEQGKLPEDYFMNFTCFMSVCILLVMRLIAKNKKLIFNRWLKKLIGFCGKCTFGIYLIHVYFVTNLQLDDMLFVNLCKKGIPTIISGILVAVIVFVICWGVVSLYVGIKYFIKVLLQNIYFGIKQK